MKKSMKWFGLAAIVAFTASCVNEDPAYKQEGELANEEVGYVNFGTGALSVLLDSDTDQTPIITTPGAQTRTALEVGDEASDTKEFKVKIRNTQTNETWFNGTWAKLNQQVSEAQAAGKPGMEIPVGSYDIIATSNTSTNGEPHPIQQKPCYWGKSATPMVVEKGVTIEEERTPKVICKLKNIKTTVEITADLLEKLDQTKKISAAVGIDAAGAEYIYSNQSIGSYPIHNWAEKRLTDPIYFAAPNAENNIMRFTFTATLKGAEKGLTLNKEIPGVKGGQWRKIRMGIKYNTEGNLAITVEVSTLMIDETINVGDVNASTNTWKEEGYDDPETMPSLQWPGVDLTQPIQLANLSGSQEALTISAPNGLKSIALDCSTSSTDEALKNDMTAMTVADLLAVTGNATLSDYGIPFGSTLKGTTSATVDMNKLIAKLRNKTEGSCTFRFRVTDQTGASIDQSVTLQMGLAPGEDPNIAPVILWPTGEFDKDVPLRADMQIDITLKAVDHFESILVEIESDQLDAGTLAVVPLPTKFDLCNLQDFTYDGEVKTVAAQAKAITQNLGLISVVNDDLKALSEAKFVITPFVEILDGFETGKFYFHLTVKDNRGKTTTKTLQLVK